MTDGWSVLLEAAGQAGFEATDAELLRDGSNLLYRISSTVVARIGRHGAQETARREVAVAQWLERCGIRVAHALAEVEQPTMVGDRPVTWWSLLPEHRHSSPAELGTALRELHALPVPTDPKLPRSVPFTRIEANLRVAEIDLDDRAWLLTHLEGLRNRYHDITDGWPDTVVHGHPWQGNVIVPAEGGAVFIDLEHVAVGAPEWDLVNIAADHMDFARLDPADYKSFVDAYGADVTTSPRFRVLADIAELRWCAFAASKVNGDDDTAREVRYRVACLRGSVPKPWSWSAI